MALAKGVNSYATVDEAEAYFADRLDVAAWVDADATQKAQSLVTATSVLDDQVWIGAAISESQKLAFPRDGSYHDPKIGTTIMLDAVTPPDRIVRATFELAYHLLNNDGLLDDTGSVTDLNISSISLSRITASNLIPKGVKKTIAPLLRSGGTSMWWRAN